MKKFLLELWHDLRAKRLWPVAALLVVALVAVPVMLKKSASNTSSPSTPPAASTAGAAGDSSKAVVVADTTAAQGSTLGVFNKKDPFKPDHAVLAALHPKATAPSSNSTQPSSSGGGNSVPSGGGNSAGDEAVFLTDTSLKAAGEGKCKPDGNTCSFLYLKLDKNSNSEDLSEVAADGTGTEYTLELLAIHKVLVSELAKTAKKAAAAARAEARRAHIGKGKAPTPFKVPLSAQLTPDTVG